MNQLSIENIKTELADTAAYKRLASFFDEGVFTSIAPFAQSSGEPVEAAAGYGEVCGCPVYAFAQNSDICSGAMSKAQAAVIKKVYELALKTGTPIVGMYDSFGARVSEGIDMLTAYGELLNLSGKLAGVVPQIALVTGPCEGTAALLASTADFVIMSEGGSFTISTSGAEAGAQINAKSGTVAAAYKDESEALDAVKNLISMLPQNNLSDAYLAEDMPESDDGSVISAFADGGSFVELYAEYAKNVKIGFARVNGGTVGVVQSEGKLLDVGDCEKWIKLVRFCDAFSIPVITLAGAEGFGSVKEAARLTAAYAEATTVKLTVITGEVYGAFYMAVAGSGASADMTIALDGACVSPVNPEAGLVILYPERLKTDKAGREQALEDFKKNECSALRAAQAGYIDSVAERGDLRKMLAGALDMLSGKREATLPKKHSTL